MKGKKTTCQYCGGPLPTKTHHHGSPQKYCTNSHRIMAHRKQQALTRSVNKKRKQEALTEALTTVPETREYRQPSVLRNTSRSEEHDDDVGMHNIAYTYHILDADYTFDAHDWKKINTASGKWTGKYSHRWIRDALGYTYDKRLAGRKPPVSVVKGRRSDNIQVFINDSAGIRTQQDLVGLLARIKQNLEYDLGARLGPPVPVTWKRGVEKDAPVRDYTVPSPYVVRLARDDPGLVGYRAPRAPVDRHENGRLGDGSHPDSIEVNDADSASLFRDVHRDAGVVDPSDPREAGKVSRAANNIQAIRDDLDGFRLAMGEFALGMREHMALIGELRMASRGLSDAAHAMRGESWLERIGGLVLDVYDRIMDGGND